MARTATHTTCEDHHRLDVRELARDGLLTSSGTVTWSRSGRVTGTISVEGDGHGVSLAYAIDGMKFVERVSLDKTAVHLGGYRPWFLCTTCERRVAVLYGGERFRCRHCHGLRYASQREGKRHRAISRIQRVRSKLSGTADLTQPIPSRPRYMHHRTYQRLVEEETAAWQAYLVRGLRPGSR
jgi:hypothetical protein